MIYAVYTEFQWTYFQNVNAIAVYLSVVEKEIRFALFAVRGFGGLKQLGLIKLIESIPLVGTIISVFGSSNSGNVQKIKASFIGL